MNDVSRSNLFSEMNSDTLASFATVFFEHSYDSVVITTGDPENHIILYVNKAFSKMTGYTPEEVIGRKPSFLSGERTSESTIAHLKNCLQTGKPFEGATTNYRKDGTPFYLKWNIHAVTDSSGSVEFFVAIQQDLSRLKNTLNRLKSTSTHFKAFLGDLSNKNQRDGTQADPVLDSAKRGFNAEVLQNNSHLEAVKQEEEADFFDDDLFDDDDLFEFDVDESVIAEAAPKELKSAHVYLSENPLMLDELKGLMSIINDLHTNADAMLISTNRSDEFSAITHDFQEMANAIFYMEEFLDVTLSLSELAVLMTEIDVNDIDDFVLELFKAVILDIKSWINAVFIDKTATDIHFWDSSIISSARQIMQFLRAA